MPQPLSTLVHLPSFPHDGSRNNADLGKGVRRQHVYMKPGNSSFLNLQIVSVAYSSLTGPFPPKPIISTCVACRGRMQLSHAAKAAIRAGFLVIETVLGDPSPSHWGTGDNATQGINKESTSPAADFRSGSARLFADAVGCSKRFRRCLPFVRFWPRF
jgi:hypothetical protein